MPSSIHLSSEIPDSLSAVPTQAEQVPSLVYQIEPLRFQSFPNCTNCKLSAELSGGKLGCIR